MTTNSFDQIPYPKLAHPATFPDALATVGTLMGVSPAPLDQCRVLEVGCGSGTNLIAMAQAFPTASCWGIDASHNEIKLAQEAINQSGYPNVQVKAMLFEQLLDSQDRYDYIIAHGVFSWVPKPVQAQLLQLCRRLLTPHGLAYISYNVYPGWLQKQMVRDMMLYHTQGLTDPLEKVKRAKALLEGMGHAGACQSPDYQQMLQRLNQEISTTDPAYVFHEYLEPNNRPMYFHEFVTQAAAQGLTYVADMQVGSMLSSAYKAEVQQMLDSFDDFVQKEQYLDFLVNRHFRQSLLCHQEVSICREISPACINAFYISSDLRCHPNPATPKSQVEMAFVTPEGQRALTVTSPVLKAMLVCLEQTNDPVSFAVLVQHTRDYLTKQGEQPLDQAGIDAMAVALIQLYLNRHIYLTVYQTIQLA